MIRLDFPDHHRSPHLLTNLVAGWHGISLDDLVGGIPMPRLAAARQDLVLILTEFTGLTPVQIGTALGGRSASTIGSIHRAALAAVDADIAVKMRLFAMRSAALALPDDAGFAPADGAASTIARRNVGSPGRPETAFERVCTSVAAAVEVLRNPDLADQEARHAAFCILTRPRASPSPAPKQVATIIPIKGQFS